MESKKRETLSERRNFRLTEKEHSILKNRAAKAGMSVSAYARSRLRTDQKIIPAVDMNLILELRDVGARLKRFFDELREHGASPERKEKHEALLDEVMEIVRRIGDAYSKR
ncbi:MAG: hypothetical protein DELT_00817 [Desulfovibrio sp.]